MSLVYRLPLAGIERLPWGKGLQFVYRRVEPLVQHSIYKPLALLKLKLQVAILYLIHTIDSNYDDAGIMLARQVGRLFWRDVVSRGTFERVYSLLRIEISANYTLLRNIFLFNCFALLAGLILPLLYRAAFRSRTKAFISFSHQQEEAAEAIEKCLTHANMRPIRIPYVANTSHQTIVASVLEGIAKCNLLICIPSNSGSFVDSEVLAASASLKPIVFVISDCSGSLPNTADKRYPVFSLERLRESKFEPLAVFTSYLTNDLRSTARMCFRSALDPLLHAGSKHSVRVISWILVFAFLQSYIAVREGASRIVSHHVDIGPYIAEATTIQFLCLGFVASLSLTTSLYLLAFSRKLLIQYQSCRRARLRTKSGVFHRSDWISAMPDLGEGETVYYCLLDESPKAHHELDYES